MPRAIDPASVGSVVEIELKGIKGCYGIQGYPVATRSSASRKHCHSFRFTIGSRKVKIGEAMFRRDNKGIYTRAVVAYTRPTKQRLRVNACPDIPFLFSCPSWPSRPS